jgi:hypothetical protein
MALDDGRQVYEVDYDMPGLVVCVPPTLTRRQSTTPEGEGGYRDGRIPTAICK